MERVSIIGMSTHITTTIKLLEIINRFSNEEIADLLDKKAKLKIEYPKKEPGGKTIKQPAKPVGQALSIPVEDVSRKLRAFKTEKEIQDYMENLKPKKADITAIAEHLFGDGFIRGKRAYTIKKLIESIAGTLIFIQISETKM